MITDLVIKEVESALDEKFDAHVVPEDEAYPTSGSTFIRVSGDFTDIKMNEGHAVFQVSFSVSCSIRTRDFLKQNKHKPYLTLIDLQEQCFIHLTSNAALIGSIRAVATEVSVTGRFTSSSINTRVQSVGPNYYGSTDMSSRREAGYVLSQRYVSPMIHVPFNCLSYPDKLTTT